MAKVLKPCKCVHCLRYCDSPTSDHVFPESWYPDTTPQNMEKWQIPSCENCNTEYSKIENDLLQRFGMCVDPDSIAAKGIADKAIRAVDSKCGRDERDKEKRSRSRHRLLQTVMPVTSLDLRGVLPDKNPQPISEESFGILIPADALKRMGNKFIRGITFVASKLYIDSQHEVSIFFAHEINCQFIVQMLNQYGKRYDRGPGIVIEYAPCPDDPQSGLYYIDIWNKVYMYGTVTPKRDV